MLPKREVVKPERGWRAGGMLDAKWRGFGCGVFVCGLEGGLVRRGAVGTVGKTR